MFTEEKEQLIFATKQEKKIISQLYNDINKNINDENNINNLCESFKSHISSKKIYLDLTLKMLMIFLYLI